MCIIYYYYLKREFSRLAILTLPKAQISKYFAFYATLTYP